MGNIRFGSILQKINECFFLSFHGNHWKIEKKRKEKENIPATKQLFHFCRGTRQKEANQPADV